ncbi:MAG: hypothetical protein CL878_03110 [Dehalococcoidia bacterium]|nr:hypothetical protein [Dehalococcoidia bacterium]
MPGLFLFLIGLVIVASMFRIAFYYFIVYFLGLVAMLAWLWVRHISRRIALRREFVDHAFQGETVTVKLQITNRSRLPLPWVKVEDHLPQPLTTADAFRAVVTLGPRLSRTVTYELVAKARGYFPVGPAQLHFGDVFGFFERMLSTQSPHYLTVYPKIIPLADLDMPSRSPFGQFRTNEIIYEDPSRVAGVRDYLRGDSWRRINWRATATLGRLQVKKYEPAITLDTMLFLNLNPTEFDEHYLDPAAELAITLASSIAHHLADRRQSVGLVLNGRDRSVPLPALKPTPFDFAFSAVDDGDAADDIRAGQGLDDFHPLLDEELPPVVVPLGKGRIHVMRMLEVLARADAGGVEPFSQVLRRYAADLPWGCTIVAIAWGRSPGLQEVLVALRRASFRVVLLLVRFGPADDFLSIMRAQGIACQEIRGEEDVRRIRARVAVAR